MLVLLAAWFATSGPGPDPTVNFFKQWLRVDPATNPVPYRTPFRDDDSLVYVSASETEVRAAMNGTISMVNRDFVKLTSVNSDGVPLIAYYWGLSSITVNPGDSIKCTAKIGTPDRILRVRFTVGGNALPPPDSLPLLPRELRGFVKPSDHLKHE